VSRTEEVVMKKDTVLIRIGEGVLDYVATTNKNINIIYADVDLKTDGDEPVIIRRYDPTVVDRSKLAEIVHALRQMRGEAEAEMEAVPHD